MMKPKCITSFLLTALPTRHWDHNQRLILQNITAGDSSVARARALGN